jgi:hypothetical protein
MVLPARLTNLNSAQEALANAAVTASKSAASGILGGGYWMFLQIF